MASVYEQQQQHQCVGGISSAEQPYNEADYYVQNGNNFVAQFHYSPDQEVSLDTAGNCETYSSYQRQPDFLAALQQQQIGASPPYFTQQEHQMYASPPYPGDEQQQMHASAPYPSLQQLQQQLLSNPHIIKAVLSVQSSAELHEFRQAVASVEHFDTTSLIRDIDQFIRNGQTSVEPPRCSGAPINPSNAWAPNHQMPASHPFPINYQMQSSNLPSIGSKPWKNNVTRRPKPYNCTACKRWFTSSGHLERHFNSTLHKKAVKQSNQPAPENMPASVYYYPNLDAIKNIPRNPSYSLELSTPSSPPNLMAGPLREATMGLQHMPTTTKFHSVNNKSNNSNKLNAKIVSGGNEDTINSEVKPQLTNGNSGPRYISENGFHMCIDCNKIFNRACYLKQHNKSCHSGEKPFKCNKCGKRFSLESLHAEHIRKHAGDRPFKCEICPKQFNHKIDLKRHICIHTGEKLHACDTCGKGFIRKDHLMNHNQTHMKKISTKCART